MSDRLRHARASGPVEAGPAETSAESWCGGLRWGIGEGRCITQTEWARELTVIVLVLELGGGGGGAFVWRGRGGGGRYSPLTGAPPFPQKGLN